MPETATPMQVFSGLVVLTLFLSSPAMLVWLILRRVRGETIVPFEQRRRPAFGLIELGVAFGLFLAVGFVAYLLLTKVWQIPSDPDLAKITADQFLILVSANSLTFLLASVCLLGLVPLRGGSLADLGITLRKAPADIALGIGAFLLMGGFVYGLQSILFQLFPQQHPLLELIQSNPQPKYFLGAFLSAGVMAPIYEEFIFRAGLQGWLEKHLLPDRQPLPAPVDTEEPAAAQSATTEGTAEYSNPYASPHAEPNDEPVDEEPLPKPVERSRVQRIVLSWLPIVISSLLFALVHLGQGPAPIPLFFLALCLGYLYQRTHRLLPCITLHAALNLTSIVMLWLSVQ